MNKKLATFLKLMGWAMIGLLSLVGLGTLIQGYFGASSQNPVGISALHVSGERDTSQAKSQALVAGVLQFDASLSVWGTQYVAVPIGLPNHQYSSDIKRRTGLWDSNLLVNVSILNEKTDQVVLVFDRALAIGRIDVPNDSSERRRKAIVYTTFITDSDSNGIINASDNAVLFSSALDGTGCRQITPDSLSVLNYVFIDQDRRLRIKLAIPHQDKTVKPEHWGHAMMWYDFGTGTLSSNQRFESAIARVKKLLKM